MKSVLYGIILMIAISALSAGILIIQDTSSSSVYQSKNSSVRLGE